MGPRMISTTFFVRSNARNVTIPSRHEHYGMIRIGQIPPTGIRNSPSHAECDDAPTPPLPITLTLHPLPPMNNTTQPEVWIATEHDRILADAQRHAKELAAREQPATAAEVRLHTQEIQASYQKMVERVDAELHPETESAAGAVDTKVAQQTAADLDRKIGEKRNALQNHLLDHPKDKGSISVPLKALLVVALTLIAFGAESLWLSGAFQVTGESRLRATWIALGVTIIMAALAHSTVHIIRRLRSRSHKVLVALGSLLIAGATYYVLGVLRARFLEEVLEDSHGLISSPWVFTLISLAVYIAVGAFAMAFFPSLEDIEAYRARWRARQELQDMEREIEALQTERDAVPQRCAERIEQRARLVETVKAFKRRIRAMYHETHAAFVRTNVMRRMSEAPKELFDPPPELGSTVNQEPMLQ